jgi:hypothetical protein
MSQPSQFVPPFPEDEKPHLHALRDAHNAVSGEVDKITGATPEVKTVMHELFGFAHRFIVGAHNKRVNVLIAVVTIWAVTSIAEKLGVDLKLFGPLINHWLIQLAAGTVP